MEDIPLSSREYQLAGLPAHFRGKSLAWSVGVCPIASGPCRFAITRTIVWNSPTVIGLAAPLPPPLTLEAAATPHDFERWLGPLVRSPRCAGCHGMESNNAVMQRHRAANWLPFDADVRLGENCSTCHQTQPGRRDPCTMGSDSEAVALCARGIAPEWRAPPSRLTIENRSSPELCSMMSQWPQGGTGPASYQQRLDTARARLLSIPAHGWAISQLTLLLRTDVMDRIVRWMVAGQAFSPNTTAQFQSGHCATKRVVGAEWGDDAWQSRAFRTSPSWDRWIAHPSTDRIERQPRKKIVEFFSRTRPDAPNWGDPICRYEWYDESATAIRILGNGGPGCPGGNAHGARIEAPAGTLLRVFEHVSGPTSRPDWAWAEIDVRITRPGGILVHSFQQPPATDAAGYVLGYHPGSQPLDGRIRSYQVLPGPGDELRVIEWMKSRPPLPTERRFPAGQHSFECAGGDVLTGVDFRNRTFLCTDAWSRRTARTRSEEYPELRSGLTDDSRECPPGQVATGFSDVSGRAVACASVRIRQGDFLHRHAGFASQRQDVYACPAGQPMVGVLANGLPICREIRRVD